ncbi:MAG: DNA polymerase III subunit beta [Cycloclasticus sp. symbiont of Poecilosclerida sp. M]|nr:MAG: DNA polymerase III subunit beta [Cycloclasticus sp. symbiont of Poecilosclerida sp. M]
MKLNINKSDLLEPLLKVSGVIERRQTLPILSNIYFSLENGRLKLIGTDLEVQTSTLISISSGEKIKSTLPGRKFLDICRSLPDDAKMTMAFDENKVLIQTGKSRFTLRTLPAAEFPLFDELDYTNELSVDPDVLLKALNKTAFCMAQQDVRYYLNGLMLQLTNGDLQTVASDGHRLAFFKQTLEGNGASIDQVIIPRKAAQEFLRLLDKTENNVLIKFAKNHINLSIGDVELNAKLIDGRFPDFKNVIPDDTKHSFDIETQSFKSALMRVSILSNEKYKGIRLDLSNGLMKINANDSEQGEAEEEVSINYQGDDMSMGFNSNYLMEALNVINTETTKVSFTDTNSSCLLEDPNDVSSRFVIMPMRL